LVLGFVVLAVPSRSLAKVGAAAQDAGQATTSPASPSQPTPAVELPEGDGKAIATEFCQDCHKLTNVAKARKAPDEWHDTVQLMMDRGARLPQDKFDTLVQYLAKNFGPQTAAPTAGTSPAAAPSPESSAATAVQPPKPVELPEGEGKANKLIFESRSADSGKTQHEYRVLKFEFNETEVASEKKVRSDLTPESKESVKLMNRLAKEGFVVREVFNSDEGCLLLERSR